MTYIQCLFVEIAVNGDCLMLLCYVVTFFENMAWESITKVTGMDPIWMSYGSMLCTTFKIWIHQQSLPNILLLPHQMLAGQQEQK